MDTKDRKLLAGGILALLIVSAGCYGSLGVSSQRAPSTYTGYVVDVEHNKGMALRTSQVIMKTHPRASETEEFCVITKDGIADLEHARDALRNQYRVTVTYSRPVYVSPTTCDPGLSVLRSIET